MSPRKRKLNIKATVIQMTVGETGRVEKYLKKKLMN